MRSPIAVFDAPRFESLPDHIKAVVEEVSANTQQHVHALLGKRRTAELVVARAKLAVELRARGLSLPQIGAIMNRDHSTIVYHLRIANSAPRVEKPKPVEIVVPKVEPLPVAEPVQVSFIAEPEPAPAPVKEKKPTKDKKIEAARELAQTMPLPPNLDSEPFRTALSQWLEYKVDRGETYIGPGLTALINRFRRWGAQRAMEAIESSMANGYQGVFEDRGSRLKPQTTSIIDLCAEVYDNTRDS